MARTIGITFEDGSDHIFENVPDDITPEQVEERVRTEFPDKQIYNIDGQGQLIHWYNDPRTERKQPTAGEMLSGAVSAAGEGISNIASGIYEAGKQEFAEEGERISQAYEQDGVLGAAGQVGQTAVDVALKDIAAPLAGFVVDTADAIVGGANLLSDIYSQGSAAQDLPRLPNGQIDINSPEYQAFARNYEVPTYQENMVGQYLGSTEGYQQGLEDTGIVSEVDRPVMGLIGTVAPAIATGGAAVAPTIGRVATGTGRAVVSGAQATGRGAQTVGRVAKDQLTGENLRYRALDAASMAAGSPVPAGAAIQALKTEGIAGALPAAGRVVGGAKGEAAGRVAQQALRGSAKQVDEAVPTSPVKPTTTPKAEGPVKPTAPSPVASIEESIARVRGVKGDSIPEESINAIAVETRAKSIVETDKAAGLTTTLKEAKAQAKGELDTTLAAQAEEARAARQAEINARKAKEAEAKAADEAAFMKENAAHIKTVDDAIEKYPELAKDVDKMTGGMATRSSQRQRWYRNPEAFNKALQDAIEAPAKRAEQEATRKQILEWMSRNERGESLTEKTPASTTTQVSEQGDDLLATIRARGAAKPETKTTTTTLGVEDTSVKPLQRLREGLKRDEQRLAEEEALTGMPSAGAVKPTPAPVAQAPKPAISPEAEARLAEIGSRPKIGETPKETKTTTKPSSMEEIREELQKLDDELKKSLSPDELAEYEKQMATTDNRRVSAQARADLQTDIRGYIVRQRQGKKNVVNKDILRSYAKDRDLDIDFSTMPDTSDMPFKKAKGVITNWMYKQVKKAPKGYKEPKEPQSPFNLLFGE